MSLAHLRQGSSEDWFIVFLSEQAPLSIITRTMPVLETWQWGRPEPSERRLAMRLAYGSPQSVLRSRPPRLMTSPACLPVVHRPVPVDPVHSFVRCKRCFHDENKTLCGTIAVSSPSRSCQACITRGISVRPYWPQPFSSCRPCISYRRPWTMCRPPPHP